MPASFDAVYRDARTPMVRVAFLIVGSQAVADEIVQEAFVRLHRHFDRVENPGGFLRTTVVRLVRGMTAGAAADALNRLHARGANLAAGLDPASAPVGSGSSARPRRRRVKARRRCSRTARARPGPSRAARRS